MWTLLLGGEEQVCRGDVLSLVRLPPGLFQSDLVRLYKQWKELPEQAECVCVWLDDFAAWLVERHGCKTMNCEAVLLDLEAEEEE